MKYRIPVTWQCYGIMDIEAESLSEALEKAEEAPLPASSYVDDSFEVDMEAIPIYNNEDVEKEYEEL